MAINNIVLINKAEINFQKGLSILSGETGSGKSILLDAIGLIIGFRSNQRLIGNFDNKSSVIAEFDICENENCKKILAENSINFDDENILIIRRNIAENINKVFANDTIIGVNLLAKIGETLVEIHGQHEQHGLLNQATHQKILDEFAGNQKLCSDLKKIYEELTNIDQKIAEYQEKKAKIEREQDFLRHTINEINQAEILQNEEELLIQKKDQINAKNKINNFFGEVKNNLNEIQINIINCQKIISRNHNLIENNLSEYQESINQISINNEEFIEKSQDDLKNIDIILRQVNSNEDSLSEIEERLFLLRNLAKKHQCQIAELNDFASKCQTQLDLINDEEQLSQNILQKRLKLIKDFQKIAEELSQRRKKSALELAKKVEEELDFLKMQGTKFLVEIINLKSENQIQEYFLNGYERVKFKASLNKNSFDEITKIASGGELSRFMLALKVALINVKSVPTMIFDEIDTGISGSTCDAVGKRLKSLATKSQILVVTHHPQIASKADVNYQISKTEKEGKINSFIKILNAEEKTLEIARMLSGEDVSNEAISTAKKLINTN
ncbi:MAG: DNA repair protein RecN [Alphaproteobacteria bacterium]